MGTKINNPLNNFCVESVPANDGTTNNTKMDDVITFIYCNKLPENLTEEKVKKAILKKIDHKADVDVSLSNDQFLPPSGKVVIKIHHIVPPSKEQLAEFLERRLSIAKTIINYFIPY